MMLRWLAGLLVAANLLFWFWSGGHLDGLTGLPAQGHREPERLAQQVEPDSIRLVAEAAPAASAGAASMPARSASAALPPLAAASRPAAASVPADKASASAAAASARAASAPASAASVARPASAAAVGAPARAASTPGNAAPAAQPASAAVPAEAEPPAPAASDATAGACLEAGPFGVAEIGAARAALAAVAPPGRWSERRLETAGQWMIYMGRYADADMLQKKKDEVAGIQVAFQEVSGLPGLEPGLSLGRFESRPAADAALAKNVAQGIRTARVVMLRAPMVVHHLRVAAADEALGARLRTLRLGVPPRGFGGC